MGVILVFTFSSQTISFPIVKSYFGIHRAQTGSKLTNPTVTNYQMGTKIQENKRGRERETVTKAVSSTNLSNFIIVQEANTVANGPLLHHFLAHRIS